jgi:pilus assembly protein CpaE
MDVKQGSLRVLIAAKDRAFRDHLRQVLTSMGDCVIAGVAVDGLEAVHMANTRRPDVAVVMLDLPVYDGLEATRMIRQYVPSVQGILIGNGHVSAELTKQAMLAGACACLSSAEVDFELLSVVRGITVGPPPLPVLPCSITAVTGGRGGIGKSTVASGLAICLDQRFPGKVVLLDMYTQFGDISTMMRLKDPRPISDLRAGEIDLELLESYMSIHETGLKVLVASTEIRPLDALGADLLESILHELKRGYRHVVIDLPPLMHEPVLRVVSLCHDLLIVANRYEVQTVTDGKKLLDSVAPRYIPLEQVRLVVNRVSNHDTIPQRQIEQALGMKASALLPNQPNLGGDPVRSNSKLAKAMCQLAEKLIEQPSN